MATTTLKDSKGNPLYPKTTIGQVIDLQNTLTVMENKIDAVVSSYVHTQSEPSNIWNIQHNLDKYPSVNVVDNNGSDIVCEVVYIDSNNIQCKFVGALSGAAYLN